MAFTENFKQIENIKNDYNGKYLKQEMLMKKYLENISKVAVDSEIINSTFADLVSYYLSKSDFNIFNKVILDDEIAFITDSVGNGDMLSFHFNDKKQIDSILYQNGDKLISITLKVKNEKVNIIKTINVDDKEIRTKSVFKKNEDGYYQESYSKKISTSNAELTTSVKEKYKYDIDLDSLVKEYSVETKDDERIISKSSIKTKINNSDYIVEDGKFYTINKKTEHNKMMKCKKLENELVKSFN